MENDGVFQVKRFDKYAVFKFKNWLQVRDIRVSVEAHLGIDRRDLVLEHLGEELKNGHLHSLGVGPGSVIIAKGPVCV